MPVSHALIKLETSNQRGDLADARRGPECPEGAPADALCVREPRQDRRTLHPANPRRSLYRGEDIDTLIKRRERGRRPDAIAASTISWTGEPIITTAISTIVQGRLYYRGRDAVALSATATLEDAAGLLWDTASPPRFRPAAGKRAPRQAGRAQAYGALAKAAASGRPTFGRAPSVLQGEAASLVGCLASAFGATSNGDAPLHLRLAAAWKQDDAAAEVIRRALVLLADQELTTSAFAARVTASTGASLGACVLSGFATLSGPLHGDATVRVRSLFDEVERTGADETIRRYLASGLPIPGFGHPLYPTDGDPRAAALLHAFDPPGRFDDMIAEVGAATGQIRPSTSHLRPWRRVLGCRRMRHSLSSRSGEASVGWRTASSR